MSAAPVILEAPLGLKRCKKCGVEKPRDEFDRSTGYRDGLFSKCKQCCREYHRSAQRVEYRHDAEVKAEKQIYMRAYQGRSEVRDRRLNAYTQTPEYKRQHMLGGARARAKKCGVACTITVADIVIPEKCPLLGISLEFQRSGMSDNSPSLDRIVPSRGYVAGNVWVISWRANKIKTDATLAELRSIVDGLERREQKCV